MTKATYTMTNELYKGYYIDFNLYDQNEYTVQYCGDDLWFDTEEEARNFINSIS